MWTAPIDKHFLTLRTLDRLRSYVRPVGAENESAGPDEVRRRRLLSKERALTLMTCKAEYPTSSVSTRLVHHINRACQTLTRRAYLRVVNSYEGLYAFANASIRKDSPVVMIAHVIWASLLASATVTSLAGLRARSATTQSCSAPFRLPTWFSKDVAPSTRSSPYIGVALFGYGAKLFFAAARVLPRG